MQRSKLCYPACKFFKCVKGTMSKRGRSIFCKLINSYCKGPNCANASCIKMKLLADGTCAFRIKIKTEIPEDLQVEEWKLRLKERIKKKLPKEELV